MQRKGGALDALRMEEGSTNAAASSSKEYADSEAWRKRQTPMQMMQRQGWNPVIVMLSGALLLSLCFSAYMYSEAAEKKLALAAMTMNLDTKSSEFAQNLATSKRHMEELEGGKRKAEEVDKMHRQELDKLHEELTNLKHSLHEEQVKATRLHRDNMDLHKRLKIKSNELKVLEDQTRTFEKEMNQLTKTIHSLQGAEAHDDAGSTDYQTLYKKQEEQQQRYREKQVQEKSGKSGASGHGKAGGRHKRDKAEAERAEKEQAGDEELLDEGHEYRDHSTVDA